MSIILFIVANPEKLHVRLIGDALLYDHEKEICYQSVVKSEQYPLGDGKKPFTGGQK